MNDPTNPTTQPSTTPTAAPEALDKVFRGELAAVESYEEAIRALGNDVVVRSLREIRDEHQHTLDALRTRYRMIGAIAPQSSGVWGTVARTLEAAAGGLGRWAALRALEEGERIGLRSYQDAVADPRVDEDTRALFVREEIPRQQRHIAVLDGLLGN